MEIISLGSNCAITYHLQYYGLRQKAYPFDWTKISIKSLIDIIENWFIDYSNIKIKKFSNNHESLILINPYNVTFAHEVIVNNDIDNFIKKLNNRINRFYELENPTFIRLETSNLSNNQIKLYDKLVLLLNELFHNYKLIVICNKEINNPNIKWIKLNDFNSDWKYPNIDWKTILNK